MNVVIDSVKDDPSATSIKEVLIDASSLIWAASRNAIVHTSHTTPSNGDVID